MAELRKIGTERAGEDASTLDLKHTMDLNLSIVALLLCSDFHDRGHLLAAATYSASLEGK